MVDRWRFQQMIPFTLSDSEWEKVEMVVMNIHEIGTMARMSEIVSNGMEFVDILYETAKERGGLIETVGALKKEISQIQIENRQLREFRDVILKAYKEVEKDA